ncbi:MAG TPA: phage tail protein [Cytophagales bacterium]|nr:phage tail protein [Cytophagales bacterium]HAA17604.1 phage tail protein [Cytophagales bacterium]HAP62039.1 phage tail protein [Cytophagales bacterium]
MADNDGSVQGAPWPLPKFRFVVNWGDQLKNISFQEVSGLDTETQIIEYRDSNSPVFSTVKMPGIAKFGNITMKRGIFFKDNSFWDWYNQIKMNTIKRQTVTIMLNDQDGKMMVTWTLKNAWPTKISSTDMKSDANEVAVDSIEIAHEGLTISMAS